jgi:hypothetical protein
MIAFFAVFQLAVAVPNHLTPKDSATLVARVRDVEFRYLLDWRHEWQGWRAAVHGNQEVALDTVGRLPDPPFIKIPDGVCQIRPPVITDNEDQQDCIRFSGRCGTAVAMQTFLYDVDQHACVAHLVRDSVRWSLSLIPFWVLPIDTEPADEALGIDNPLAPEWRDTVRARRVPLLRLLDSTARMLPGDRWIAGQRVRVHLDENEPDLAMRAAEQCRAAQWWCGMLRGYVRWAAHDVPAAAATFDSARARMPADTLCRWDDVSALLIYSARAAYAKLSCAQRRDINKRIWWLGDPLYLEPGNVRRTTHYARAVMGALHAGNDVDVDFHNLSPPDFQKHSPPGAVA